MKVEDAVERTVLVVVIAAIVTTLLSVILGCHFHLHVGERHTYERCSSLNKEVNSREREDSVVDDLAVFERLADEVVSGGPDNSGDHPDH